MKFNQLVLAFAALLLSATLVQGADQITTPPRVITTTPANGTSDVDPFLDKITVTFSKPMLDKSWSWSYEDKESFPEIIGQPSYPDNETTCVLPVKLKPGKRYVIWINTTKFKNFKDKNGKAAEPYKLVFMTKQR